MIGIEVVFDNILNIFSSIVSFSINNSKVITSLGRLKTVSFSKGITINQREIAAIYAEIILVCSIWPSLYSNNDFENNDE